jgi:7,8-dihydropterin-6-yl-methyl-4-(beta-D-ribofuranosyl)aminobenzene 5'-phosphate synthase
MTGANRRNTEASRHYARLSFDLPPRKLAPSARVLVYPEAFRRRFARPYDGPVRSIGIRSADADAAHHGSVEIVETTRPTEVVDGLFVTGQIPRKTDYEDTGGPFFLDEAGQQPDFILDDQALFYESEQSIVILLGCAHAGVINTVSYIRALTRGKPIHAVIGGMHLGNASSARLKLTREALRQMGVGYVCPAHCTGACACADLRNAFSEQCGIWSVGSRMKLETSGQLLAHLSRRDGDRTDKARSSRVSAAPRRRP